MPEINGLAIHQGASSHNAWDAMPGAFPDRWRGHTPLTKGSMEPYARDVAVQSLPHDLSRDVRMSGDHNAVKLTRYTGKIWIAPRALDF